MSVKIIESNGLYEIKQYLNGYLQDIFDYEQFFELQEALEFCKELHFKIVK